MGMFDSLLPDFSDPNSMATWGALGQALLAGGTPRPIQGMGAGNALALLAGNAMQGGATGAQAAQEYQKANIGNQIGALNLKTQQAIQPLQVSAMQGALTGAAPGSLSGGDPRTQQLQQDGWVLPGDLFQKANTFNSLSIVDPKYASAASETMSNAVKLLEEGKMYNAKTGEVSSLPNWLQTQQQQSYASKLGEAQGGITSSPQGPIASSSILGTPSSGGPPASPVAAAPRPATQDGAIPPVNASALQAPPVPSQIPNNPFQTPAREASFVPPAVSAHGNPQLTAADGKAFVPETAHAGLLRSDPTGTPKYKTDNTTTGVDLTKAMQAKDIEGDANFAASINNSNQMVARLRDIIDAYKTAQPGTLIAQYPDIANKLIAMGAIDDKGTIKNVAEFQRASSDLITETMNQIKNANAGSAQSRILSSEFQGLVQKMADPHLQPEAIHDILAMGTGLANYASDKVKGWQQIGGLGNRLAGGYTMRPAQYEQSFELNHDPTDYIEQAKKDMGPMKGEPVNAAPVIKYVRKNGKIVPE